MATATATLADKPFFLQAVPGDPAITYTAADFRRLAGAIWPRAGTHSPGLTCYQNNPIGWSVIVSAGFAVLAHSTSTSQERYLVQNQAAVVISLSGAGFNTAPPTTRVHKVWLVARDEQIAGTLNEANVLITEDTGAGAPTPTGGAYNTAAHLLLATITIASGQANIQNVNIDNTVSVHADTGYAWTDIPLSAGISDASGNVGSKPPRVLLRGGSCYLRGVAKKTAGFFAAGSTTILGRVDTGYRPSTPQLLIGAGSAANTAGYQATSALSYRLQVGADGYLTAQMPGNYDPTYVYLDGLHYDME